MNFQNNVLAATVGMLTCPDEYLGDALARCDRLFDSTVLCGTDEPSVENASSEIRTHGLKISPCCEDR